MATDLSPAPADPPAVRRRPRVALFVAAGVAVPLIGLVAVLATRPPSTTRVADSPLVGLPAPEVIAQTLDGDTFRLADTRGRWVLVNFFATWCVPCRQEHRHLVAFDERHRVAGDAMVVGVIYDDDPDAVRSFMDSEGGRWSLLVDPDGAISVDFGAAGVPESFLIAPDGTVAARVVGGVRADELERLLAEARTPRS